MKQEVGVTHFLYSFTSGLTSNAEKIEPEVGHAYFLFHSLPAAYNNSYGDYNSLSCTLLCISDHNNNNNYYY